MAKPSEIPNEDKKRFTEDTANSKSAVVSNSVIAVQTGIGGWQPVFACESLIPEQSCEIEVVDYVNGWFMIGVARNKVGQYQDKNSMCIRSNGRQFANGNE